MVNTRPNQVLVRGSAAEARHRSVTIQKRTVALKARSPSVNRKIFKCSLARGRKQSDEVEKSR